MKKKFDILTLFQIIFVILVMAISIYGMVTKNDQFIPFLLFFMSFITLISGFKEYKRTHSLIGSIFYLCSTLFILFVAIKLL
jgi:hypothetical protein